NGDPRKRYPCSAARSPVLCAAIREAYPLLLAEEPGHIVISMPDWPRPRWQLQTRSRLRRQRGADQFLVVAGKDLAVGVGRRGPGKLSSPQNRGWFDQTRTADLAVGAGRESGENQVPLVSKEKRGITIWRQVDAGAGFQLRHVGRPPNLFAGARLQADQFAVGSRRVHVIALQ